jgi:hypothetical protein
MELAPPALSVDEILAIVEHLGGLTGVLGHATDEERAALYAAMGVSAAYDPARNEVRLGVDPVASTVCRRGDLYPNPTRSRCRSVRDRCVADSHHAPDYSRDYSRNYPRPVGCVPLGSESTRRRLLRCERHSLNLLISRFG